MNTAFENPLTFNEEKDQSKERKSSKSKSKAICKIFFFFFARMQDGTLYADEKNIIFHQLLFPSDKRPERNIKSTRVGKHTCYKRIKYDMS